MIIGQEKSKFIPQLLIEYFYQNGIDFIKSLPEGENITFSDVVYYCEQEGAKVGKSNIDFEKLLSDAIAIGYDERYSLINETTDERNIISKDFINCFQNILEQLNIKSVYLNQDIIVVGIGNGCEGKLLYSGIEKLTIVDIAPNTLKFAKEILPYAKAYQARADNMAFIPDKSYDVYISLRTYQSTYFDISSSLSEAHRILRDGGRIIISIACGYVNNNKFMYGLFNPYNGVLESKRPNLYLKAIKQYLLKLKFELVNIEKLPTEIFISAIKRKTENNN